MEEEVPRIPARLPLLCTPIDDETISGFVIRLMERNQLGDLEHVRNSFGRRLPHDLSAATDLGDLAALSGVSETRLRAMAGDHIPDEHPLKQGTIVVGGHRSVQRRAWGPLRRFCPGCLAEAAYHRMQWDFLAIQHCAIHGNALAWACPDCLSETTWRDKSLARCKCGFELRRTPPTRSPENTIRLVALLDALLRGDPNLVAPKLSGVPFAEMVDLLENFGGFATGNRLSQNPRDADTTDTLALGLVTLEHDDGAVAAYMEKSTRGGPFRARRAIQAWASVLRLERLGQPWSITLARAVRQALGVEHVVDARSAMGVRPPPAPSAKWSYQNPQLELFPQDMEHGQVPAGPPA